MSNPIWKTSDQKPKQEELVAWEDRKGMHSGRFDTCYNCFCACADYRADLRKVKKWCSLENLDNLIAQADKTERAIWWLKEIVKNHRYTPITTAEMALKELDGANN